MKTASSIARAMQSFVIEGGRPLSGSVRASGNKNGALPILAACVLASERGAALERAADPRRRDDGRAARRSRCRRRVDGCERRPGRREWRDENRSRRRPRARDPRVVPSRRPAPRALRSSDGSAAGRRRHRSPAARHAHSRIPGARRRRRAQRCLRDANRRASRQAALPRRGVRHGNGERDHGCRARRGRDVRRARGLRAAHPGSLSLSRLARREHRGHRLERPPHRRRRRASRRRVPDRPGAHRGRELRRPRGRDRRRRHDRGRRAGRPHRDRPGVPEARHRDGGDGLGAFASRRVRIFASSTTSAGRFRRSRAASGPPSPRTSRRSPSPAQRSRTGRSSSSRRCSRAGSSSWTSSSRWERGSSCATRTARS